MSHYREFLRSRLSEIQKKNPRFSMRAFAQTLKISPAGLSKVLSGKKGLSLERAFEISKKLSLNDSESETFLFQVQLESTKNISLREQFLKDYQGKMGAVPYHDLSIDQHRLFADWYGLSIYECLKAQPQGMTAKDLAKYFTLNINTVEETLDRLKRLDLVAIGKNKRWTRHQDSKVRMASQNPDQSLRKHYHSVIEKIQSSIDEHLPKDKVIGTESLLMSESKLDAARALTEDYWSRLVALSAESKSENDQRVYQSFCILFPVTHKISKEKNNE
jgi:uncharacterized protein (TIGR02147 family)